ncbi:MAG: flagellar export chaperone FliS, partial [Lachnospiraceae bacterium]|nr:flagellar export chaperone FliS [Lachnospiraceae bacterium]
MAMPARNPYAEYTTNKIMTATPAEVTLMLYEGAIKFCNIAITAIEQKDIQKAHTNIMKAQRIIEEFRNTLDRKYSVAEDFDRIYVYLLRRLFEANVKKDKDILEEVNMHLRSVR